MKFAHRAHRFHAAERLFDELPFRWLLRPSRTTAISGRKLFRYRTILAFAKKFTVYTEFKKITGLQPGAVVRVSGAKAGSITQIFPPYSPGEKFRVKLEITEDLHQLVRTDSVATIETEGLVGGNYLGISTGTPAAPPVAPNATIAAREPFDIAGLMQQVGDTIKKVNDTIDDMKDDVLGTVAAISDTVDNANTVA